MKAAVAKMVPTSYEVICPNCHETIAAPNGSLFWTKEELQIATDYRTRDCEICHLPFTLPKPRN